ncbi:MAG: hypothetical protein J6A25_04530 [Lachnospiraceae bacterium]|nr:hypothetical protein [Lachnospiraceae bacterium]
MKAMFNKIAIVLSVICVIAFASPAIVMSAQSLDDLSSGSNDNSGSDSDNNSISDYLQNYNPVTKDNMEQAGAIASPIVNALGTLSGFIVMIASAGIFVVTALDLVYIGMPFTRSFLNPKYGAQMGGASPMGGMGMGGMGMGMHRGYGGMGAMGAMGGGAQQAPEQGMRRQWVSDEAEYCVNFAQRQDLMSSGGVAPIGGMPQQTQPTSTKSVILMYLKKRAFFLVIFSVCVVVLMSSLFTDCGLNLAELISKVMNKIGNQISSLEV